jgi:hypothetical protein
VRSSQILPDNTNHPDEPPRGFRLRGAFEEGDQGDEIAATIARGEVSPTAGPQIDFERARTPISARGIGIFPAEDFGAGNETRQHGGQGGERRAVDRLEIELVSRLQKAGRETIFETVSRDA